MVRSILGFLLSAAAFLFTGCDSGNPVAPAPGPNPPSGLTVTLGANPTSIEAGSATPSTITVTAKNPDGSSAPNGSEVTLTTSLGSFTQSAEPQRTIRQLLNNGTVQIPLYAGTETGTASLIAQVGSSVGRGSVTIAEPPVPVPAPVAEFTFVANGLAVTFTDASTGDPTKWKWDFGDGEISTVRHPVHQYSLANTYTVKLEVESAGGTSERSKFVTLSTGPPIAASFDFEQDPNDPRKVQFFDRSTGDPTAWSWTFGDDKTSSARNPSHVYASDGTFSVTLVASNPFSSGSVSRFINTTPTDPPIAAAFDFEQDPNDPKKVQFFDRSTGNPTAWSWTFGDDKTSSARNPSHTYADAATFTVSLLASNAFSSGSVSRFINTAPAAPTADFDWEADGRAIQFVNKSTNGATLLWDFGDGKTSTETNPRHTYATAGEYPVTLTATNAGGSANVGKIVATDPVPDANFTFSIDGTSVAFTDKSTNTPTSWKWRFDDGTLGFDQNPVHVYPGTTRTYAVTLEATNASGTGTITKEVKIVGAE
ncbi:MAG: PKD domain-containing protein [Thermoanaerobaculia bacterium]